MRVTWTAVAGKALILLVGRVFSKLSTIVVMVLIARKLGTEEFGVLNGILALTAMIGIVSDFGLVMPTIRSISQTDSGENRLIASTMTARLVWTIIAIAVMIGAGWILNFRSVLLLQFGCAAVLDTGSLALIRSFEGKQEMGAVTFYVVAERLSFFLFVVISLSVWGGLSSVGWAQLASSMFMFAIAYRTFCRRFGELRFTPSLSDFRRATSQAWPFFLTAAFSALFYRVDTLILSYYRSSAEVGVYAAAQRITDALAFIPAALMASAYPVLARSYRRRDGEFENVFRDTLLGFLTIGAILSVSLGFFAREIIVMLFSRTYEPAGSALGIFAFMIVFYFLNYLLSQALMAMQRERVFLSVMLVAAGLTIAADIVVVPWGGYIGAAWVRVSAEVFSTAVMGFCMYRIRRSDSVRNGSTSELSEVPLAE